MARERINRGAPSGSRLLTAVCLAICWTAGSQVGAAVPAGAAALSRPQASAFVLPISFEPNRGQAPASVRFLARAGGGALFVTDDGMVLTSRPVVRKGSPILARVARLPAAAQPEQILRVTYAGAASRPRIEPVGHLPGTVNYFIGSDPRGWHTGIPTFAAVIYRNVYPGINLAFRSDGGTLEYDWRLGPHANPNLIRMRVSGSGALSIDRAGSLVLAEDGSRIVEAAPAVYQSAHGQTRRIPAAFMLSLGGVLSFRLGHYDRAGPLVIDPKLRYTSSLAGDYASEAVATGVDSAGDAFVAGSTDAENFPTEHAVQPLLAGDEDAFVAKLNPAGNALLYSTYFGGADNESDARAIVVTSGGKAYLTGSTRAQDFPVDHPLQRLPGGYCAENGGRAPCTDAFVVGLAANGEQLLFSTYLGGKGDDDGNAITLDRPGNLYVTGTTSSTDFPTVHPFQSKLKCNRYPACSAAFVAKISPGGQRLLFSTYLGGSSATDGYGIAVSHHQAIVAGDTAAEDFPLLNPVQSSARGKLDVFVTRLSTVGNGLVYSTRLGGKEDDAALYAVADGAGNAYVTGFTYSPDFPIASAAQPIKDRGHCTDASTPPTCDDAFVVKLTASGNLSYSTFLGGNNGDGAGGIAVDRLGQAYVTGDTSSTNFPVVRPLQAKYSGETDAFVAKLSATGSTLLFGSYLGGSSLDMGNAIAVDRNGDAFVAGSTLSSDFPGYRALSGDSEAAYVVKISTNG